MRATRGRRIACAAVLACVAACSSPGGGDGKRFVVLGEAVVRDARTGLEWTRHDDGAGLQWQDAEAYCRALSPAAAGGWRLPSIEELRGLHDAGQRTPCGEVACGIDPAFTLTSPYVWTATAPGPGARTYLDFRFGNALSPSLGPRLRRRTLCVRDGRAHAG